MFRHIVRRTNVEARLHRQHHPRLHQYPFAIALVFARVMHIQPQPVPGAMHVKLLVGFLLQHARERAFAELQIDQPLREHLVRHLVIISKRRARFHRPDASELGLQHQLINIPLRPAEFSGNRKRAGDIGGVTFQFAAGIDQHQIALFQQRRILPIVQHAGIGTGGDDAAICGLARAVFHELMQQFRFDLIFIHARLGKTHRTRMRVR